MDISLHSFILVVGLVVMAFILWDGVKKVRESRANRLTIKLGDLPEANETDQMGNELPNGGARVIDEVQDFNAQSDLDREPLRADLNEFEFDDDLVEDHLVDQASQHFDAINARSTGEHFTHDTVTQTAPVNPKSAAQPQRNTTSQHQASSSVSPAPLNDEETAALSAALAKSQGRNTGRIKEPSLNSDELMSVSRSEDAVSQAPSRPSQETTVSRVSVTETVKVCSQPGKTAATETQASIKKTVEKTVEKAASMKRNLRADKPAAKSYQTASIEASNSASNCNDEASVPMLMESIRLGENVDSQPIEQVEVETTQEEACVKEKRIFRSGAFSFSKSKNSAEVDSVEKISTESRESTEGFSAFMDDEDGPDPLMDFVNTSATPHSSSQMSDADMLPTEPVGERLADRPPAQEVLVINVLKEDDQPLMGAALKHIFNVCDMRHGEMGIYHRFEQANAQGKIQFSVANGVEPGTFDPKTMDQSSTPGISFFMSLPGPVNPMEAFDAMVEVAHVFARNFNAEIHDESHSDLTPQTIEHCRQRIRDFTRKHLSTSKA